MRRYYKCGLVLAFPVLAWLMSVVLSSSRGTQCAYAASCVAVGSGGWEWVKPIPGAQWWWSACFIDDKTGWIGGGEGVILKTIDGGAHWAPQGVSSSFAVTDIHFADRNLGWAVGDGILKTTDGGATWRKVYSGADGPSSICFVSRNVGWAAGGRIMLKTVDGGETWSELDGVPKPRTGTSNYIDANDVSFADENNGWLINNSHRIYKTTDGGKTWSLVPRNAKRHCKRVQFLDARTGWVLAGTSVLRTTDGGATWTEYDLGQSDPPLSAYNFRFRDAQNGVVGCIDGRILRTQDGGRTWSPVAVPVPALAPAICMVDDTNGWIVGRDGTILHTSDGAATWQAQSSANGEWAGATQFPSPKVGWMVCSNGKVGDQHESFLLKTQDGGRTWDRKAAPMTYPRDVCFADEKTGWVAGTNGTVAATRAAEKPGRYRVPARASTCRSFSLRTRIPDGRSAASIRSLVVKAVRKPHSSRHRTVVERGASRTWVRSRLSE